MPAEHAAPVIHDLPPQDPQSQVKLCFACRCPLSAEAASAPFLLQDPDAAAAVDASPVCASCRSRLAPPAREGLFAEVERELLRRAASLQPAGNEAALPLPHELVQPPSPPTPTPAAIDPCPSQDMPMDVHAALSRPSITPTPVVDPTSACSPASAASLSVSSILSPRLAQASPSSPVLTRPTLSPIDTSGASSSSSQAPVAQRAESHNTGIRQRCHGPSSYAPDPLADITRLRVRSQGHHCLYPGATFKGTQKSGRNSYDVNVTIVVRRAAHRRSIPNLIDGMVILGC